MSNYLASDTDLTSVANAIRTKGGTSAQLAFPAGFVSAIDAIPTGGGGGIQSASGQVVLASADSNTQIVVTGLAFTPNAFIVFSYPTEMIHTVGAMKFCGFFQGWIRVKSAGQTAVKNTTINQTDIPDTVCSFDAVPGTNYYSFSNDGFSLKPMDSNYTFQAGIPYYWKAWRFE